MKMELVKQSITRFGGRTLLTVKHYAPEILTGVGILGYVGTAILAGKQTLKLPEITENIDSAKKHADVMAETNVEYAKTQYSKDLREIYVHGTWDVVKLYAPAVGLGVASTVCILSAHGILRRRNIALAAAYVTLDKAFNDYRKRVQDKYGEEEERKIWLDEQVVEVPDEDGKPMALTTLGNPTNPYGRWFDEGSVQFSREPGYNMRLLLTEQNYFNDRLKSVGHVLLNDVYDRLGLPRTYEGSIVGWYYDKENPEQPDADDYIDFGIMDPSDPSARDFINGWNKVVWLDFNVQGPIIQKLPKNKS